MTPSSGFVLDRSGLLTEAESAFVRRLRDIGRAELADGLLDTHDQGGLSDAEVLLRLGKLGLLELLFNDVPGVGAAMRLCLLRETLAFYSERAETSVALQGLGTYPILQCGSDALIAAWLPRIRRGEAMAAFALSEPGAGSDLSALSLSARPAPDGTWTLTGRKKWISNAPHADFYVVFARVEGQGRGGISAFVVRRGSEGLSGAPLSMISPHALGELNFERVRVGAYDILGREGDGMRVALRTLDLFRPSVGAFAVGMSEAAYMLSCEWVRSREIYGGVLGDLDSVRQTIARMRVRIDAARLLIYRAARALDSDAGLAVTKGFSAAAKVEATETAQWVVDRAIQLHGARALEVGHRLERLYREVRAPRIYEGASEVQYSIIANCELGPRR